jgi:Xaa-Pro aminopeptidase
MSIHLQRRDKLKRLYKKAGADAMLVASVTNVSYLTGFTGDSSYLLLSDNREIIFSDRRYETQLPVECPGIDLEIRGPAMNMIELLKKTLPGKFGKIALEASALQLATYLKMKEEIEGLETVPTTGLVEELRLIKDKDELAAIRRAISMAERAFAVAKASMRRDQTEKEMGDLIDSQIRAFGGIGTSFPPIVASGPRAALPHAGTTPGKLGEYDFVLVDWGAREGDYISDLTRMLVFDKIPSKLAKIHQVVAAAQDAAFKTIKHGANYADVDAAARKVIEDAGYGPKFSHSLGHGIGRDVHEAPRMAASEKGQLKAGMVVTVEPGIYLPEWGGVRLEDDVLVTKTGCELLSHVPRSLEESLVV